MGWEGRGGECFSVQKILKIDRVVSCDYRSRSLRAFIIRISTVMAASVWTYFDRSGHRHWPSVKVCIPYGCQTSCIFPHDVTVLASMSLSSELELSSILWTWMMSKEHLLSTLSLFDKNFRIITVIVELFGNPRQSLHVVLAGCNWYFVVGSLWFRMFLTVQTLLIKYAVTVWILNIFCCTETIHHCSTPQLTCLLWIGHSACAV